MDIENQLSAGVYKIRRRWFAESYKKTSKSFIYLD